MASSDDEDIVFALALSAREAAQRPAEASRRAPARAPLLPSREAPIELGDSSDDEIQILDSAPPQSPRSSASAGARQGPPARRENAAAPSSTSSARVTAAVGGVASRAAISAASSSSRPAARSGYVEANAVRRDDVRAREAAELARHQQEEQALRADPYGYAAGGSGVGEGRMPLGSRPTQDGGGGLRLGGPPLPPAESFEEGGMDAEMMLAMHKSRDEEERKRLLKKKQRALMAETDEEEAMRLAIEASLNEPPPPPAQALSRKRAHSTSTTSSVTESEDDSDEPDPETEFQKQLDDAVKASKAERRRLVIPRATAETAGAGLGPLFGRPGLFDEGGGLSGTSTPVADEAMAAQSKTLAGAPTTMLAAAGRPTSQILSAQADAASSGSVAPQAPAVLPTGATRAQMEAERLLRVQARQAAASGSLTADAGAASTATSCSVGGPIAPKRARMSSPAAEPSSRPSRQPANSTRPPLTERFWQGTLGMTHNAYASQADANEGIKRSFRLPELISEPENLVFTIFSTYCIEPAFLGQCLPHPKRAPVILISHPPTKDWAGKSDHSRILPGVWDRFPWVSFGSCHMKFMLLWYIDGRMRVVITTANFFAHDWESIENIVWVQDFKPRTEAGRQRSDFGEQWVEILKALGVSKTFAQVRASLGDDPRQLGRMPFTSLGEIADKWDFSAVTIRLVASLAGKREGWDEIDESGIGRLGRVLREEGWVAPPGKELAALEAQGSSIGEYTRPWTNVVWRMVRGEEPRRFLRAAVDAKEHAESLKVVFPTLRTVDATVLGRPGGGTLFCTAKKFAMRPQYFHDSVSKRGARTVMHLKVLTGVFDPIPQTLGGRSSSSSAASGRKPPLKQQKLFESASDSSETEDDDDDVVAVSTSKGKGKAAAAPREPAGGFMYIGSHNFTPSAWGRITMAKAATKPTLSIQNYELGILFPLREADAQTHASSLAPYQRPVRPYRKDDVPWCMDEHLSPSI